MLFVDTHCHLDMSRFDSDRDAMIARAIDAGVTRMVVPALDLRSCESVIALAERHAGVYCAVGVHPNSAADWQPEHIELIREFAKHPKVVAIGEIGLDYYWDKAPHAVQHAAFVAQMALAAELDLPVIIHNRESSEDCMRLMSESALVGRARAGVLHSFSAPAWVAQKTLELGFYLGFTGPITYKKAADLRRVAVQVPLDRMLLETDAPYLSPTPKRGRRNEPAYVPYIADRMAALHQTTVADIAQRTTANAERLFNI